MIVLVSFLNKTRWGLPSSETPMISLLLLLKKIWRDILYWTVREIKQHCILQYYLLGIIFLLYLIKINFLIVYFRICFYKYNFPLKTLVSWTLHKTLQHNAKKCQVSPEALFWPFLNIYLLSVFFVCWQIYHFCHKEK